jgi:hypothetical protein
MRKYRWLYIFLVTYSFYILFFSLSPAEEDLSAVVKMIQSSTVLILTYDNEGNILGQGRSYNY